EVVLALAAGLTAAVFALVAVIAACGFVVCILVVLGVIVAIAGFALTYVAQGCTAALTTTSLGFAGKNRNVPAAVCFSILSCLLGLALATVVTPWLIERVLLWYDPELVRKGTDWEWQDWLALVLHLVGCVIAVVSAGLMARHMVKEQKFCEDCEQYMEFEARRGLSLGHAKAVTQATVRRRFAAAADLLDSPEGKCAIPTLFWCAKCGQGYLEVQAKFECTWAKKGQETEQEELETDCVEEWVELEREHVALFREPEPKEPG